MSGDGDGVLGDSPPDRPRPGSRSSPADDPDDPGDAPGDPGGAPGDPGEAPADEPGVLRATAGITAGNVVSRVTGFVRVLAIGAALGATYLGNTYQTSNLVSNVLFELLAAGLLSSVLVPVFVDLIDRGERREAEVLAGTLLTACLAGLGAVTVAGAVGGRWVMRALTVAVEDAEVRRREVELGSFFLWFFLPQLLLYAVGAVATALLHAGRRFAAAAFAPAANNLVVTATMAAFWVLSHGGLSGAGGSPSGGSPSGGSPPNSAAAALVIPAGQRLVLAVGTTAGVLAMTAIPLVALWRAGTTLRPRWRRHPELRRVGRQGLWAIVYLAVTQLLVALTLVLANRVAGGVVAYQIAFTFFLLPHALFAHPTATALYPRLAADALARRWDDFSSRLGDGLGTIAFLVLPASALLVALSRPLLRLLEAGALGGGGSRLVARVLVAYSLGLGGYSAFHLLTRAAYAMGDMVSPAVVNLVASAGAAVAMVVGFTVASGGDRVVVLGLAHSAAMLCAATVLYVVVSRRLQRPRPVAGALARILVIAGAAGAAAWAVATSLDLGGRAGAAAEVAVAGTLGALVYLVAQQLSRAPELRRLRPGTGGAR